MKKIILETSDTWSMRKSSHWTSDTASITLKIVRFQVGIWFQEFHCRIWHYDFVILFMISFYAMQLQTCIYSRNNKWRWSNFIMKSSSSIVGFTCFDQNYNSKYVANWKFHQLKIEFIKINLLTNWSKFYDNLSCELFRIFLWLS